MDHLVKITDTTLRDAHQSLWATRMSTADMLPITDKLDRIGYHSLEVWGGVTFDVCLRYLNEDPWERLRLLKKQIRHTPLQMLLRGQSLVGYQSYPDDVVECFVEKAVENGINIIRVFDALNDVRNLRTTVTAAKKAGAHVQAAMVYTISPIHTNHHYLELAQQLVAMGADSICIKDMAGLLAPYQAYDLVKLLKENIELPLQCHSHYIGGLAVGAYIKAVEAGVDVIDTATMPLAFGASQPPVETVVRALQGSNYDTGLNIHDLFEIAKYFEGVRKSGDFGRGVTRINDLRVFDHQVPGVMISNLVTQLEEQKALYRLGEVLDEIPVVRRELGYPPLVTPNSQIVGTQAVLNVLTGERYKLVPGEVKDYIAGKYGRPPAPVDQKIMSKVLGDREPITCRPADLIEPRMDKIRKEAKDLVKSEEEIISYALFPQVARRFLDMKHTGGVKEFNNQVVKDKNKPGQQVSSKNISGPVLTLKDKKKGETTGREVSNMNLQDVKELIKIISETDISEVSLESSGVKVAIRKGQFPEDNHKSANKVPVHQVPATSNENAVTIAADTVSEPISEEEKKEADSDLTTVTSPMVGTFYRASAPNAPPYVEVGDRVHKGQTLCIIEAMKLMNEIESEVTGEVVKISVDNGTPVEYGQTIFLIKE